ncbi:phosphoserine aminotransferase [Methylomarinovum caldicuralii]|uniref:Phosphoserine aminotransferase n=1 Tax=Methylomarinovum caldicuralii TaxID=438856 RepID=A0AAU9C345_9GAMM|nr:3-phosphoserine/phosphohydroxythreonine transaminase [Methylomarinovum caldicuralii]BCX81564.1 phosphoserine aminotransferase [Methylomarinovum caldicuralii]
MRVYNFSAGPSMLPEAVLQRAREEMLDWQGSGMSVMEMSHRGPHFRQIAENTEALLRQLLGVSDDYHCLFLQGGATGQFAAIPMNLLGERRVMNYVLTGSWGKKAAAEAKKYGEVRIAASSEAEKLTTIPDPAAWDVDPEAVYLHYTSNETIGGVEFPFVPEVDVPLVCDMSSDILSRPVDVSRFGVIYAGAQKNMGPAGITVVIVRKDLLRTPHPATPQVFDYARQAEAGSMLNTPPTYSWYLLGLVLEWLRDQGGVEGIEKRNVEKAGLLYGAIDASDFYRNPVDPRYRSRMNVPFTLADPSLDSLFLEEAKAEGLVNLKGHRSVGGMRASIYNAMPLEGVQALVQFMREFERRHG